MQIIRSLRESPFSPLIRKHVMDLYIFGSRIGVCEVIHDTMFVLVGTSLKINVLHVAINSIIFRIVVLKDEIPILRN